MFIFFSSYSNEICCLCGSSDSLTGEHKIKASLLRKIFGRDSMVIGSFGGDGNYRNAQGIKSKNLHFSARLCAYCNNTSTQKPDQEFVKFHELTLKELSDGNDPNAVFELPQYSIGGESYLNVFRYFAKLLCCHVADAGGPRILEISTFSIGVHNRNKIFLQIDQNPIFPLIQDFIENPQYASHGGLVVYIDRKTNLPEKFLSSITFNEIRYTFWIQLSPIPGIALKMFHKEFWKKCEVAFHEALKKQST